MNKDTILATAVTRWDAEDQCFLTRSILSEDIIGAGLTPTESSENFKASVEIHEAAYKRGQHPGYSTPGRPKRERVKTHLSLRPETKTDLARLADALNLTQGDLIDFVVDYYKAQCAKAQKIS